jgi:hypothetical protein
MSVEAFLSEFGYFISDLGFQGANILLFICSFVLCIMAFKAAGAARRARNEAQAHMRSAQDLAVEVRHLTAQVEKAAARRTSANAQPSPVRVSAAETTEEAEIEIIAGPEPVSDFDDDERFATEATLEEAKRGATVPSALLGGLLRRKP